MRDKQRVCGAAILNKLNLYVCLNAFMHDCASLEATDCLYLVDMFLLISRSFIRAGESTNKYDGETRSVNSTLDVT